MYKLELTEQEMAVVAKAVMNLNIKGKDAMLVANVLNKIQKQVEDELQGGNTVIQTNTRILSSITENGLTLFFDPNDINSYTGTGTSVSNIAPALAQTELPVL